MSNNTALILQFSRKQTCIMTRTSLSANKLRLKLFMKLWHQILILLTNHMLFELPWNLQMLFSWNLKKNS